MDAIRVAKVSPVLLDRTILDPPFTTPARQRLEGTLHLTPHHLIFSPTPTHSTSFTTTVDNHSSSHPSSSSSSSSTIPTSSSSNEIWIPYPTIVLLARLPQTIEGLYPLSVGTKTFESYTLFFAKDREGGAEDVWQSVRDCAVASSVEQLYGFFYALPPPSTTATSTATTQLPTNSGWNAYNPRAEYTRQGVGSRTKAWRFTDINRDYSLCPTYPAKLVVPSRISDSVLVYAAKYRSKGRIPALTYLHWANNASITRSSQPMVGLKNARSAQDERLIECIFTTHQFQDTAYGPSASSTSATPTSYGGNLTVASTVATSTPLSPSNSSQSLVYGATTTNLIIDARPTANAVANVAKGAGTENMEWYKLGKKAYMGIDNIHVMRNSLKTIIDAIREAETTSFPVDRERLRKSGWLRHMSAIIDGSLVIVRNVHIASSHVLIHCSDGWDRTSQLSAIAQICLDPFYRTFEGFKVLVEKDWLSFGHMFNQRSGHLSSDKLFTATPDNINGDEDSDEGELGGAVKGAQAFFASVQKQFASNAHLKETSPVFHQFLDAIWQIQRQFPDRFEFNEDFLMSIHYHLYACQFGTFLFDSERERRTASSGGKPYVDRTVSVWDWLDRSEQREFYKNDRYNPKLDDRNSRETGADMGVLLPDPRDVRFWYRLFKRGDDEMNGVRRIDPSAGGDTFQTGSKSFPSSSNTTLSNSGSSGVSDITTRFETAATSKNGTPTRSDRSSTSPLVTLGSAGDNKDTFRAISSTSSAFSLQTQPSGINASPSTHYHAMTNPPSTSSGSSASASPFARLRGATSGIVGDGVSGGNNVGGSGNENASFGGGQWNWSQISSGARSALNQIKTMSVDAIGQLRAEVGEIDANMWGRTAAGSGTREEATSGTTILSGSGDTNAAFPKASLRIPSEANPWSSMTDKLIPNPPNELVTKERMGMRGGQVPKRDISLSSNPWSDSSATTTKEAKATIAMGSWVEQSADAGAGSSAIFGPEKRVPTCSLADLRLDDEVGPRSGAEWKTIGVSPGGRVGDVGVGKSDDFSGKTSDQELLEAAMGGDRKAWDPLGAL